jgi:hypothetical protein
MSEFEPRVLMRDRRTGKLVLFHTLPDGSFAVETRVDVEGIVEHNKTARSTQTGNWKGDMHMVAKIPMHMWQSLRTEGRVQETRDFKKWLNDGSNSAWRLKTGRL